MKHVGFRVAIAFTFLLGALTARAYILPTSFLLERMASKRTKMDVRRLKVTMQCNQGSQAPHQEILYLKNTGLVRRERGNDIVEICRKGKCWRKEGKAKATQLPKWSYLTYIYFVEVNAKGSRYQGLFQSLGIDTKVNTMSRFHSRLAIILGAKNWERDRPQFWLDKDWFLPLRLMVKDGSTLMDILWIGWGTKTGGDWFPEKLETRADGKTTEHCQVTEVKTGVSMPESMFKL